jgi:hypothetical protein
MLQPDGLLAQLSLVLYHRASTLEFLHQLSDSYRAPWRLLGLDFHQLAIYGLLGTHIANFKALESITLFWSPWGSKDSGCSKIKIAKVKACCYSTFTLAIYCFMDFATNVKKKKEKAPHTAEIAVKYSHYKILRRSLFL